ncbi:hypothetical protein ACFQHO_31910 [Actinomadura yumaensis]|uniref:hypothetical protein n=1 Tax=Actinomadura TaxID=1988 RepID=UPI001581ACD4|nr:hypothetical protein [Actinomadura sp. J1-007]
MPPWANRVAHLVPFTVLPSGVWRIALGLGVPVGFHGELADLYHAPDWRLTPYVFALSLLAEGCALLTLGLVRPWGEVFPRWLPFVGGGTCRCRSPWRSRRRARSPSRCCARPCCSRSAGRTRWATRTPRAGSRRG